MAVELRILPLVAEKGRTGPGLPATRKPSPEFDFTMPVCYKVAVVNDRQAAEGNE